MSIFVFTAMAALTDVVAACFDRLVGQSGYQASDVNEAMPMDADATSRSSALLRVMQKYSHQTSPRQVSIQQVYAEDTRYATTHSRDTRHNMAFTRRRSRRRSEHYRPGTAQAPPPYGFASQHTLRACNSQDERDVCNDQLPSAAEVFDISPNYETLAPSAPPPDYGMVILEREREQALQEEREEEEDEDEEDEEEERWLEHYLMTAHLRDDESDVAPTVWRCSPPPWLM